MRPLSRRRDQRTHMNRILGKKSLKDSIFTLDAAIVSSRKAQKCNKKVQKVTSKVF